MAQSYDPNNVFARILRGEIPNDTVLETPHTLVFRDITPKAPVHLLAIPKGAYMTVDEFYARAPDAEILDFTRAVARVCEMTGLSASVGGNGFRAISNAGADGMQEVPHFHLHILGGRPMGALVEPA